MVKHSQNTSFTCNIEVTIVLGTYCFSNLQQMFTMFMIYKFHNYPLALVRATDTLDITERKPMTCFNVHYNGVMSILCSLQIFLMVPSNSLSLTEFRVPARSTLLLQLYCSDIAWAFSILVTFSLRWLLRFLQTTNSMFSWSLFQLVAEIQSQLSKVLNLIRQTTNLHISNHSTLKSHNFFHQFWFL